MNRSPDLSTRHRARFTAMSLVVAAASVVLFAYSLRTVGLGGIASALSRVGATGFLLVIACSGIRQVVRSLAWMSCVEGEERLDFGAAFAASVMGEAVGNLTPLATIISEPAKAVLVRDRVPLSLALPAIIVENIFYTATVGLVIGIGGAAFLLGFPMPERLRLASVAAIAAMIVIVGMAWLLLRGGARPVSGPIAWLAERGWKTRALEARVEKVRKFEERVSGFASRNRSRLGRLAFYECAFHAAGVAEVYVTLAFLAPDATTFLKALVLEAVGRVINVLFKFIPMRFGVDEAGNLLLARPLGLPPVSLVALPLVRKARILFWTALGVALLLRRGLSVRRTLSDAEGVAGRKADAVTDGE